MTSGQKQYSADSPELRMVALMINLDHFFKVIHDQLSITYFGIILTAKGENPSCRQADTDLCQLCGVNPDHFDDEFAVETEALFRQSAVENAEAAVAASSLVFAHSVVEDLLMKICRICADVDSVSWTKKISKRSITIEEVDQKTIVDLKREQVEKYLSQLEKESMLKKLDVFLGIIQPNDFASSRMKKYDRERIAKIDRLRHECVHEAKFAVRISNIKEHLDYLYEVTRLLSNLFCDKYNIEKLYDVDLARLARDL
ncbi:hypothetical protein [Tichowtungia aerotolerans]|uniref:RiboL-PSP-HEPN domain-containing protein n=1 Tax=Tichowtungia aerotolerans TaxID=2697043 RepID=A0A6P1M0H4_9BACT|nr:hypothetical protein [Tichowtungia aerotolerans]QHI68050.1 hypothetical protein GT409_00810 [Tichowtungia aerotolerans]